MRAVFAATRACSSVGAERMLHVVALLDDLGGLRLALDGARDGFLGRLIVVLLDLLVVVGFPMDEHADRDEQVIGLGERDHAFGDRIGDGLGDAGLRRAEHLNGLLGVLDGDLVEEDRVRLGQQVRRDDGEQRGEAVLVVDEGIGESRLGGAAARSDQQVDVGDFIAFADERLADHELVDQGHVSSFR